MAFKIPVWYYFIKKKSSYNLNSRYKHIKKMIEDKIGLR